MISSAEQIELFRDYYSFDILELISYLKKKNESFNLLNSCSKQTNSNFVDLLCKHIDLKKMYLSHLKS